MIPYSVPFWVAIVISTSRVMFAREEAEVVGHRRAV